MLTMMTQLWRNWSLQWLSSQIAEDLALCCCQQVGQMKKIQAGS